MHGNGRKLGSCVASGHHKPTAMRRILQDIRVSMARLGGSSSCAPSTEQHYISLSGKHLQAHLGREALTDDTVDDGVSGLRKPENGNVSFSTPVHLTNPISCISANVSVEKCDSNVEPEEMTDIRESALKKGNSPSESAVSENGLKRGSPVRYLLLKDVDPTENAGIFRQQVVSAVLREQKKTMDNRTSAREVEQRHDPIQRVNSDGSPATTRTTPSYVPVIDEVLSYLIDASKVMSNSENDTCSPGACQSIEERHNACCKKLADCELRLENARIHLLERAERVKNASNPTSTSLAIAVVQELLSPFSKEELRRKRSQKVLRLGGAAHLNSCKKSLFPSSVTSSLSDFKKVLRSFPVVCFDTSISFNDVSSIPDLKQDAKDLTRDTVRINGEIIPGLTGYHGICRRLSHLLCSSRKERPVAPDEAAKLESKKLQDELVEAEICAATLLHLVGRTLAGGHCFEKVLEVFEQRNFCFVVPDSQAAQPLDVLVCRCPNDTGAEWVEGSANVASDINGSLHAFLRCQTSFHVYPEEGHNMQRLDNKSGHLATVNAYFIAHIDLDAVFDTPNLLCIGRALATQLLAGHRKSGPEVSELTSLSNEDAERGPCFLDSGAINSFEEPSVLSSKRLEGWLCMHADAAHQQPPSKSSNSYRKQTVPYKVYLQCIPTKVKGT